MDTHDPNEPAPPVDGPGGEPADPNRETVEELQRRLADADPGEAPEIAEDLASRLGERLDEDAS